MVKTPTGASPTFYLWELPGIVAVARELGYALGVHGSLARDLDVIACPWVETAAPAEELVEAIRAKVGGCLSTQGPTERPHGRRAWSIHLGGGPYIDLSVMPRSTDHEPEGPGVVQEGEVESGHPKLPREQEPDALGADVGDQAIVADEHALDTGEGAKLGGEGGEGRTGGSACGYGSRARERRHRGLVRRVSG